MKKYVLALLVTMIGLIGYSQFNETVAQNASQQPSAPVISGKSIIVTMATETFTATGIPSDAILEWDVRDGGAIKGSTWNTVNVKAVGMVGTKFEVKCRAQVDGVWSEWATKRCSIVSTGIIMEL